MLPSRTAKATKAEVSCKQAMHTTLGDTALTSVATLGACGRTPQLCAGCKTAGNSNSHTHAMASGDGRRSDWRLRNTMLSPLMQKKASNGCGFPQKMPANDQILAPADRSDTVTRVCLLFLGAL